MNKPYGKGLLLALVLSGCSAANFDVAPLALEASDGAVEETASDGQSIEVDTGEETEATPDTVTPPDSTPPFDTGHADSALPDTLTVDAADSGEPSKDAGWLLVDAGTPVVTHVSWSSNCINKPVTFTITGSNLSSNVGAFVQNCTASIAPTAGDASTRTFTCSSGYFVSASVRIYDMITGYIVYGTSVSFVTTC